MGEVCNQVPKQECHKVPRQVCNKVPKQECKQIPRESCKQVPRQSCTKVPKQGADKCQSRSAERFQSRCATRCPRRHAPHSTSAQSANSQPMASRSKGVAISPPHPHKTHATCNIYTIYLQGKYSYLCNETHPCRKQDNIQTSTPKK